MSAVDDRARDIALAEKDLHIEQLRSALALYADLDTWEHVPSPVSASAWVKKAGHPTPWVDAQEALG